MEHHPDGESCQDRARGLNRRFQNSSGKRNRRRSRSEHRRRVSSECAMSYKSEDQIQESLQSKKNILFSKLSGERLSRQIKQQKESLPYYVEKPKDLVGKIISQKCSENNTIQWFDAQVISIKKLKADTVKTEYNIRYDDCPDDVWFFPLLMDLKKGDLLIKS
ncbi:Hypothetical predicted protein [Mytilus galloprovincialis]|uniref:Uncharacterized protein n=1 Tax=Mytilus galloprovincialis TaxID=29158 RepID=A0A8B6F0F5_MYTGA|nr:Hypothetical predicted protein [Mytilus galloprovincialis]